MQLSEHFSLAEFTRSDAAMKQKINNTPTAAIIENLKRTAAKLEEIRAVLGGKPIIISSGYRSRLLNVAIGGSSTSDHVTGLAADFTCPAFGSPYKVCQIIIDAGIKFDQLIYEQTWVHIGIGARQRYEVLTFRDKKYYNGLI